MSGHEKQSEELEFEFLSDLPLQSEKDFAESKFGHEEIASALSAIASSCPTPFTIGLFGKWGAGKSSIANQLRADLQQAEIPVVIFDVWKHQGDALRRTFLRESLAQIKALGEDYIDPEYELDERLDKDVQHTAARPSLDIPWLAIRRVAIGASVLIALSVLVDWRLFDFHYSRLLWQWGIAAIGTAGFVVAVTLVFRAVKAASDMIDFTVSSFVGSKAVTYTVDKFLDPRDFEQEFERLLCAVKSKRVVVVFDNLDRVVHDKAVEVLSTIKTFLEPTDVQIDEKETVFVIPCDAGAIREHIQAVYQANGKAFSPDEFLRKFFSTVLWIPDFIPSELERYTKSMLQATKVADLNSDKVAWIITKAYRDNPRQIKQFINILLANYLLIRHRQGADKDFPDDFLATHTPQLARFLLLTERFPEQMGAVRASRISSIEQAVVECEELGRAEDFCDFVNETSVDFPIPDIRLYFTLRRSEHEKLFPGIEEFFVNLEDRKLDSAVSYLEQTPDFTAKRAEFNQVVKQQLQQTSNELSSANAISTLLAALDRCGLNLTETGYGEIYARLISNDAHLVLVQPSVLVRQVAEPFVSYRPQIAERWVAVLQDAQEDKPTLGVDEAYVRELLSVICEHPDWFSAHKTTLGNIGSQSFSAKPWALAMINGSADAQALIVTPGLTQALISSLSGEDIEKDALTDKVTQLLALPRTSFGADAYQALLTKGHELIVHENGYAFDAEREERKGSVLAALRTILTEFGPALLESAEEDSRNEFLAQLASGARAAPDIESRGLFVPTLLVAESLGTGFHAEQVHSAVSEFFRSASPDSIERALGKTSDASELISDSAYAEVFEDRARQGQAFFDKFYPRASEECQEDWLNALLDEDPMRLLKVLEAFSYKAPGHERLVERMIDVVEDRVLATDGPILVAVGRMRCGDVPGQQTRLAAIVQRNLTSTDTAIQQVGLEVLSEASCLDEQSRREVAKAVLEWLRDPALASKYQQHAILAVVRERSLLNEEERNELMQFLFEELLRKGTDAEQIEFGFDQLDLLKPTYSRRKANFDDVLGRTKGEEDDQLRALFIRRLKSLQPRRRSKSNTGYWEEVDELN